MQYNLKMLTFIFVEHIHYEKFEWRYLLATTLKHFIEKTFVKGFKLNSFRIVVKNTKTKNKNTRKIANPTWRAFSVNRN